MIVRSDDGAVDLAALTADDFSSQMDTVFAAQVPEASVATPLRLTEVHRLNGGRPAGASPRREPFSLIFRAPATPPLSQGVFLLEHPAFGVMEIFLVPVAGDPETRTYEAVFG